ncbi:DUF5723 family protein [Marinigracilibium pacificum]|uniref:DUF5723 domain-containing protein n=1 Tax=Marinigracilibium pacificum TaxID=2729599 RepID=A0A848J0Z6_9BACT|nr:DUF5723 family protein [Marinigracilibium pacificum]NMM50463.1 hypothetical protein [Marinigracilibium pacificum]
MKRILFYLFAFFFAYSIGFSQDFSGSQSSNFYGYERINIQPAATFSSTKRFNFSVYGNLNFENNMYSVNFWDLLKGSANESNIVKNVDGNEKNLFGSTSAGLGLSMNVNKSNAIGFSIGNRTLVNGDNFDNKIVTLIYESAIKGNDIMLENFNQFDIEDMRFNSQSWLELKASYARVIMDDLHFLKVGTSIKALNPLYAASVNINEFKYTGQGDSLLYIESIDATWSYNSALEDVEFSSDYIKNQMFNNWTAGVDIGAVYEYRPESILEENNRDNEPNYLLKAGFSIIDIGGIKYERASNSGSIKGSNQTINMNDYENLDSLNNNLEDFFSYNKGGSFKMSLPTSIVLELDYRIQRRLYLNVTSLLALKQGSSDVDKTHNLNKLIITPRYEGRYAGAMIPISFNSVTGTNIGMIVRGGPLWFGSTNILSSMASSSNVSGGNIQFGLNIGIPYKKKSKNKEFDSEDGSIEIE